MKANNNITSPPRTKTSVALQGLDRSTPDDIVTDGKCAELHNLRFKDNAWRAVHPHKATATLTIGIDYHVVYKHPATPDTHYIIERMLNGKYYYSNHDTSLLLNNGTTLIASFNEKQKVTHFGNILIFTSSNNTAYYIFKDNAYRVVDTNMELPYISVSHEDKKAYTTPYTYFKVNQEIHLGVDTPIMPDVYHNVFNSSGVSIFDKVVGAINASTSALPWKLSVVSILHNFGGAYNPPSSLDGRICGNICFILAYRMSDGSIIQVSPLNLVSRDSAYNVDSIFKGEFEYKDVTSNATGTTKDTFVWAEASIEYLKGGKEELDITLEDSRLTHLIYSIPTITATIPTSVLDSDIVDSIAIYATRVNNAFDIDKFEELRENVQITDVYNSTDIVDQSFYLYKDIPIAEIKENGGKIITALTANELERMIHNEVYTPITLDTVIGQTSVDYNNRLHVGNTTTVFGRSPHFSKIFDSKINGTAPLSSICSGVEMQTDNGFIRFAHPYAQRYEKLDAPYNRIFSYPSTSVHSFLTHTQKAVSENVASYPATKAYSNSFAYYIAKPTNEWQFPSIEIKHDGVISPSSLSFSEVMLNEPNRIIVSATNNCFAYAFDNIYRVGSASNKIIALQSAAIEMREMKVGELPLYAFTTEGIFVLVAGSETLYASIAPINYDKIINPNTLAINGAIVYITEKGVHLLTTQGTQVISSPIHNEDGMPPLDFLRTCKIIHPKQYNEIVLLDESSTEGIAYVYNLDAGYWSTRDLKGHKLNTGELCTNQAIYNLDDEDETQSLAAHFSTRPIKLGNVEFKRLETIIPRMSSGSERAYISIDVDGSVNGRDYSSLRSHTSLVDTLKVNPFVLRRTPFSAKYFKVAMSLTPMEEASLTASITHIDVEWYTRFLNRMR